MLDFTSWEEALGLVEKNFLAIRVADEEEKGQLIFLSGATGCSAANLTYNYLVNSLWGLSFGTAAHFSLQHAGITVMTFGEVLAQIAGQNICFNILDELL